MLLQEYYLESNAYKPLRFQYYFDITVKEVLKSHSNLSPKQSFEKIRNNHTDSDFLTETWRARKKEHIQTLEALKAGKLDFEENETRIRYRDMGEPSSKDPEESGMLPVELGLRRMLEMYSSLYEISKDPLHDLAANLDPSKSDSFNNHGEVLAYLNSTIAKSFTDPIVGQLRHGPSHESVVIDDDEFVVRIYNSSKRDRIVQEELSYEETVEKYYATKDMVAGVVYGVIYVEEILQYEFLDSDDFRYLVAENASECHNTQLHV